MRVWSVSGRQRTATRPGRRGRARRYRRPGRRSRADPRPAVRRRGGREPAGALRPVRPSTVRSVSRRLAVGRYPTDWLRRRISSIAASGLPRNSRIVRRWMSRMNGSSRNGRSAAGTWAIAESGSFLKVCFRPALSTNGALRARNDSGPHLLAGVHSSVAAGHRGECAEQGEPGQPLRRRGGNCDAVPRAS